MPTVDIPDRVCSHCGGTRYYIRITSKGYKRYTCVIKAREYNTIYARCDKRKEAIKNYRRTEKGKAMLLKALSKHRLAHPEKVSEYNRTFFKKHKDEYFIKRYAAQSFGVPTSELTQEQIEQYREYIKTLRLWRQLQANNS